MCSTQVGARFRSSRKLSITKNKANLFPATIHHPSSIIHHQTSIKKTDP
ncbi:hypothetical protein [Chryseobacterium sp. MP_3.2]|nr:hypothetical protein [Chryseobacterium sp. MP_3.2]